jgi:hypothetical protein
VHNGPSWLLVLVASAHRCHISPQHATCAYLVCRRRLQTRAGKGEEKRSLLGSQGCRQRRRWGSSARTLHGRQGSSFGDGPGEATTSGPLCGGTRHGDSPDEATASGPLHKGAHPGDGPREATTTGRGTRPVSTDEPQLSAA